MLVDPRATPLQFDGIHLCTSVERGAARIKFYRPRMQRNDTGQGSKLDL